MHVSVCVPAVGFFTQSSYECVSMQTPNTLGAAHQSSVKSGFVTHKHTYTHTHSNDLNLIWNPTPQGNMPSI